ncbi:hemerythrin domain-containing protein [Lysobacter korlensis]|uniref:Hemerythrin domain-containing protein n=1 Tax=Lysobacter korlensis TaxID=553636 RepID=A0ABV6S0N1_9GAMM
MTAAQSLDEPGCNTDDMLMVHGLMRLVFRDAEKLVRAAGPGDPERASTLGQHVLEIADGLHRHHTGEDQLLWDQLSSKSPGCAIHVGLMKRQHAAMGEALDRAEEAAAAWQRQPDEAHRAAVLASLENVNALLNEHLGDEERLILPTAGQVFTQREWNRLGDHGRAAIPKNRMFIQLGFILDSMPPDVGRQFLAEALPAPARVLYRLIGRRQYIAHRRRVYGALA